MKRSKTYSKEGFLNIVKSFPKFGSGICLYRVSLAMEQLGLNDFTSKVKKLAITGTNGKGSVAKLVNNILSEAGLSCGLFTSPHFIEFNERFKVNGVNADYKALFHAGEGVLEGIVKIESNTQEVFGVFEFLFLVGLKLFKDSKIEMIIFEAGIGGRYDPVRLLQCDLTALTSIDLEHCNILGYTKELIAFDKVDACMSNGAVAVGNIDQSLKEKIINYLQLRGIECHFNDSVSVKSAVGIEGLRIDFGINESKKISCSPNFFGYLAIENLKTAILLTELISKKYNIEISESVYKKAIEGFENSGRLSVISNTPKVLVDSAHTAEAYRYLFETLKDNIKGKIIYILGITEGRDTSELVKGVSSFPGYCVLTRASFKGEDPSSLYKELSSKGLECIIQSDLAKAIDFAVDMSRVEVATIVICGGLFLAGEATSIFNNQTNEDMFLY